MSPERDSKPSLPVAPPVPTRSGTYSSTKMPVAAPIPALDRLSPYVRARVETLAKEFGWDSELVAALLQTGSE
jgi:hypothetical protein